MYGWRMRTPFRRHLKPGPAVDEMWLYPETAILSNVEREAARTWTPPPPKVHIAHHRNRLIVLRVDLSFMGIGLWSDEPVTLPDDVANADLGNAILAELGRRRLGLPSPTRPGWSAVDREMAARLGVSSIKAFLRDSNVVSVVRDAGGLSVVPTDTRRSPTWGQIDSLAVHTAEADDAELGRLVREALTTARGAAGDT